MTLRTAQVQSAMDLAEIDDIPFDFSADIITGETISGTPAVTCERISGAADATPQNMVTGAPLVGDISGGIFTTNASGKVVLQRFTAQVRDVNYAVRCVITLSSGRKLTAAGELPVLKLASPA